MATDRGPDRSALLLTGGRVLAGSRRVAQRGGGCIEIVPRAIPKLAFSCSHRLRLQASADSSARDAVQHQQRTLGSTALPQGRLHQAKNKSSSPDLSKIASAPNSRPRRRISGVG